MDTSDRALLLTRRGLDRDFIAAILGVLPSDVEHMVRDGGFEPPAVLPPDAVTDAELTAALATAGLPLARFTSTFTNVTNGAPDAKLAPWTEAEDVHAITAVQDNHGGAFFGTNGAVKFNVAGTYLVMFDATYPTGSTIKFELEFLTAAGNPGAPAFRTVGPATTPDAISPGVSFAVARAVALNDTLVVYARQQSGSLITLPQSPRLAVLKLS
jgi:hypothetical protein